MVSFGEIQAGFVFSGAKEEIDARIRREAREKDEEERIDNVREQIEQDPAFSQDDEKHLYPSALVCLPMNPGTSLEKALASLSYVPIDDKVDYLKSYARLKARHGHQPAVERGFFSTADDIARWYSGVDTFYLDGKEREFRFALPGFTYRDSVEFAIKLVDSIVGKENTTQGQRSLEFNQPYTPRDHWLLDLDGIDSNTTDRVLKDIVDPDCNDQMLTKVLYELGERRGIKDITSLRHHDLVLPPYLRRSYAGEVTKIIMGKSASAFLSLDPELKTHRCTGGKGGFRKVSYQYALSDDITTVDLCFNNPYDKVAEAVLVDAKDREGKRYSLVETVEASEEAFVLPYYEGMPGWAYLMLEEIVLRARESGRSVFFSTAVDKKPAPNIFLSAAVKTLNLSSREERLNRFKLYKPLAGGDPGVYEFATVYPWVDERSCENRQLVKLEMDRENPPALETGGIVPETYLGAWNKRAVRPGVSGQLVETVNGISRKIGKIASYIFESNPINNGRGYVKGFVYPVTNENYEKFEIKMKEVKRHMGLIV